MQLIANKDFRYKSRDLRAGASFKADDGDVLVLTRTSPPLACVPEAQVAAEPPAEGSVPVPRADDSLATRAVEAEDEPATAAPSRRGRYARRDMRARE